MKISNFLPCFSLSIQNKIIQRTNFILNDRYERGLSSLRRNITNTPKHVAGPTSQKVQFLANKPKNITGPTPLKVQFLDPVS